MRSTFPALWKSFWNVYLSLNEKNERQFGVEMYLWLVITCGSSVNYELPNSYQSHQAELLLCAFLDTRRLEALEGWKLACFILLPLNQGLKHAFGARVDVISLGWGNLAPFWAMLAPSHSEASSRDERSLQQQNMYLEHLRTPFCTLS